MSIVWKHRDPHILLKKLVDQVQNTLSAGREAYILVPNQFSSEMVETLFDELQVDVLYHVRVVTFASLAKEILRDLGEPEEMTLSESGRVLFLRRLLEQSKEDEALKGLRAFSSQGALPQKLAESIREYRQYAISPEQLQEYAKQAVALKQEPLLSDKLAALAHLYTRYEEEKQAHSWQDLEDRQQKAFERMGEVQKFQKVDLFVHQFHSMSQWQMQSLLHMEVACRTLSMTLCLDARMHGQISLTQAESIGIWDASIFETPLSFLKQWYAQSLQAPGDFHVKEESLEGGVEDPVQTWEQCLEGVSEGKESSLARRSFYALLASALFSYQIPSVIGRRWKEFMQMRDAHLRYFSASHAKMEVETVVESIQQLVQEKAARYQDIQIYLLDFEQLGDALQSRLLYEEIPYFADVERSFQVHPLVQWFIHLFHLLRYEYRMRDVIDFIKNPFFFPHTESGPSLKEERRVEQRQSFQNVVTLRKFRGSMFRKYENYLPGEEEEGSTLAILKRRLREIEKEQETKQQEAKQQEASSDYSRLKREYKDRTKEREDTLLIFQQFDAWLVGWEDLKKQPQPIARYLELARQQQQKMYADFEAYGQLLSDSKREEEYQIHQQIWSQLLQLWDDLETINGEEKLEFETFAQMVEDGVEAMPVGIVPAYQDQVLISHPMRSRTRDRKYVFILGVDDQNAPSVEEAAGILYEREIEALREQVRDEQRQEGLFHLPSLSERAQQEQAFGFYLTLQKAKEQLHLSYSLQNANGNATDASIWLRVLHTPWEQIPGFFSGKEGEEERTGYARQMLVPREKALDEVKEEEEEPYSRMRRNLWLSMQKQEIQPEALLSLGKTHDRRETQISPEIAQQLYWQSVREGGEEDYISAVSPTQLKDLAQCPYSYFLKHGLHLKEEESGDLQSFETGNVAHRLLEEFFLKNNEEDNRKEWLDAIDLYKAEEKLPQSLWTKIKALYEEKAKQEIVDFKRATARQKAQLAWKKEEMALMLDRLLRYGAGNTSDKSSQELEFELEKKFEYPLGALPLEKSEEAVRLLKESNLEKKEQEEAAQDTVQEEYGELDSPSPKIEYQLYGSIDNVVAHRGAAETYWEILDYKSGKENMDVSLLYDGEQVQLPLYLAALLHEKQETMEKAFGAFYFSLHADGLSQESVDKNKNNGSLQKNVMEAWSKAKRTWTLSGFATNLEEAWNVVQPESLVECKSKRKNEENSQSEKAIQAKMPYPENKVSWNSKEGNYLSPDAMSALVNRVKSKALARLAARDEGNIAIQPRKKGNKTPCSYCSYRKICHLEGHRVDPERAYRLVESVKHLKELSEKLDAQGSEHEEGLQHRAQREQEGEK